jgi:hypothetical protein
MVEITYRGISYYLLSNKFYRGIKQRVCSEIYYVHLSTFMEAIPFCSFLSKLDVFSLTRHRFIVIQFVTFICVLVCIWAIHILCNVFVLTYLRTP